MTITRSEDDSGISFSSSTSNVRVYANNGATYTTFTCEFDIVSNTGEWTTLFVIANEKFIRLHEATPNDHIKIWNDGTDLYYQINDGTPTKPETGFTSAKPIGFRCNTGTLKIKNFKIYSI